MAGSKIKPVTPIWESIYAPKARLLARSKSMVKIIPMQGIDGDNLWVNCLKEINLGKGATEDNLEERSLDRDMIGLVVGIATPSTICRVLITVNHPEKDGIYHVCASRLQVVTQDNSTDTKGNKVEEGF